MNNTKVKTAISNFLDEQAKLAMQKQKLAMQEQEMLNAAAEFYGKKNNIVINKTIVKVGSQENLKGVVVGITWHSHEDDDDLIMSFSWRTAIIKKDGTRSKVIRLIGCGDEIFVLEN